MILLTYIYIDVLKIIKDVYVSDYLYIYIYMQVSIRYSIHIYYVYGF